MVKKLFKHEFLFYARVMAVIYAILLTISAATRIILAIESDTDAYQIVLVFTMLIYYVSFFSAVLSPFVMGIVRFYRNLFTSEGYLSFTLPVTASQHIIVKAVTAVCMQAITLIVVALSGVIVLLGNPLWEDLAYAFELMFVDLPTDSVIHLVLYGLEFFVMVVLSAFVSIMLYYCFISIGQLSKKNRILAAVGAYFAWYIISQILTTVLTVMLSMFAATGAMETIGYWIYMHPVATVHVGLCGGIVLLTAFLLIEFMVIRHIITKKLNLE